MENFFKEVEEYAYFLEKASLYFCDKSKREIPDDLILSESIYLSENIKSSVCEN